MAITKPYCKKLKKKNAFLPFEGREHIEFLGFKNDCSLFCFGSHNKKRPHNITIGRLFDFHILDMVEMGITAIDPIDMSRAHGVEAGSIGSKPFFVFEGSEFATDPSLLRFKSLLIDFFRGNQDVEINLDGCDRVLFFSLRSDNGQDAIVAPSTDSYSSKPPSEKGNLILSMRHYAVQKPHSAAGVSKRIQNVELYDIGPNFDFQVRRISFATPQEFKVACRLPKATIATLRALRDNVTTDGTNSLRGQLHVGKQDVNELNLRRFKAHKRQASAMEGDTAEEAPSAEAPDEADKAGGRRHKRRKTGEESTSFQADVDV
ncbi:ribosome production factor 2 [Strigomonas culicis]|nr:ribosome production factor 2 [Strigomonas culicis]|eukprot:EPY20533.1 ribosome production factor 2 [Strigomonas culicis]